MTRVPGTRPKVAFPIREQGEGNASAKLCPSISQK